MVVVDESAAGVLVVAAGFDVEESEDVAAVVAGFGAEEPGAQEGTEGADAGVGGGPGRDGFAEEGVEGGLST